MSYNCAPFIERAIHGMVSQKINVSYKIIIHDDASTDGSADIIRKYAKKYPEKYVQFSSQKTSIQKGRIFINSLYLPILRGIILQSVRVMITGWMKTNCRCNMIIWKNIPSVLYVRITQ